MPELVKGAALPADPGRRAIEVVGVRPGEEVRVLLLGDELLGVETHWVKDTGNGKAGSRLCTYLDGDCPYHEKERFLWVGFIAALEMTRKARVVLRVGEETARAILRVCGRSISLRGAHLLIGLKRTGSGTLCAVEMLHEQRAGMVPAPHPIEPSLCAVFGVERLPDYGRSARELAAWKGGAGNGGVS